MKNRQILKVAAACAVLGLSTGILRADDEFGDRTVYYEDDAWYDISEWFDGNDYNPTDEAIGRWDDEVWDFSDNLTSTDTDNDRWYGDYGYRDTTADADRWYWDYYDGYWTNFDDWDNDGNYDQLVLYLDNNDDGLYDATSTYRDTNDDGLFDKYTYFSFGDNKLNPKNKSSAQMKTKKKDSSDGQKQASSMMKNEMKRQQVSGTIDKVKKVDVRGTQRTVAQVKTDVGQTIAVDLGTKAQNVSKDAKIQVSGPILKVGDKSLLLASNAKLNDQQLTIDRGSRQYKGSVESTREVTVRGQKHLLARIKTDAGKKLLADLGPADRLASKPTQGQQVQLQGIPVKMQDRVMLMTRSITRDGQTVQIHRQLDSKRSAKADD